MIKKVIIVYLIVVSLIVGTYIAESLFLEDTTIFAEKKTENVLVTHPVSKVISDSATKAETGNIITGSVIQVNSEEDENARKKIAEEQQSGSEAKVKVSVEVVG